MLCVVTEETERVIGERRLKTLRDLGTNHDREDRRRSVSACGQDARREHGRCPLLSPLPQRRQDGKTAPFRAGASSRAGTTGEPRNHRLDGATHPFWPLAESVARDGPVRIADTSRRFRHLRGGPRNVPPKEAIVLPLTARASEDVLGIPGRGGQSCRQFDDAYRGFYRARRRVRPRPPSRTRTPTRRSASGPRRSPNSTAPRPPSSRTSATSSARR